MSSLIAGGAGLLTKTAVGAFEAGSVKEALLGTPGRVQFIPQGGSSVLEFDASISETHARDADPTAFPLEDGRTISDHIIVKPFELSINGFISDNPIGGLRGLASEATTTALSAFAGPLGITGAAAAFAIASAMKKDPRPSAIAFAQLLKMQAGEPDASPPKAPPLLDIITTLRRYPNMVIKSISAPRDASTGQSLRVTVTLTQLTVVRAQVVDVSVFANAALSANKGELGEQGLTGVNGFKDGEAFGNKITGQVAAAGGK